MFQNRLFRIPDYQRGYAWTRDQLIDFWDDFYWSFDKLIAALNAYDYEAFASQKIPKGNGKKLSYIDRIVEEYKRTM